MEFTKTIEIALKNYVEQKTLRYIADLLHILMELKLIKEKLLTFSYKCLYYGKNIRFAISDEGKLLVYKNNKKLNEWECLNEGKNND